MYQIQTQINYALVYLGFIAIAICIRTNQNPNSVRRRFAPPHTIWVLCPNKNGDSYTSLAKLTLLHFQYNSKSRIAALRAAILLLGKMKSHAFHFAIFDIETLEY